MPTGPAPSEPSGGSAPGSTGAAAGTPTGSGEAAGDVASLEKKVQELEGKLSKSPGDAATQKALAVAYTENGMAIMNDASLPPRQKYPPALRLFRKALKLDPKQSEAAQGKDAIEAIYRQMGMPIPP